MKKGIRILIPIVLSLAILLCMVWYLFVYDREFTRDILLSFARYNESQGNHGLATHFYNAAYAQSGNSDSVAVELAMQYKSSGNYTKAEYTLSNAIADGGGIDVYIALCKIYVEQDKLLDAVNMLNSITKEDIKAQLDAMRPQAPVASPEPGFYRQYISVSVQGEGGTVYACTNGQYPSTQSDPFDAPIPLTDGDNTVYALTVADNGLVSPLTIAGYTIGGIVEKMEFADPAMEAAIRNTLSVADDAEIFTNDLWKITEFTIPEGTKVYSDLKHMVFLESLTIENGVSDELSNLSSLGALTKLSISGTAVSKNALSTIGTLPKLNELHLNHCEIGNIAPLETAISLVTLDLSNNNISNISALSNMAQLQNLNLSNNTLVDLAPLSSCNALINLDVSSNIVSTLAPISNLKGLTHLNAGTNSITELGAIENLTALTHLMLPKNKLSSIAPLAKCVALTDLDISSNALTDISSAAKIKSLVNLNFAHNQVTTLPAFEKNCALVTIDGSSNKISSLKPLSGLEHLNTVNMDYNTEISSVDELANCPVLIEVNVYATKVTDVSSLTNQSIIVNYNPVQ